MIDGITVRAAFAALNIKAGKTVLQFELDAKSVGKIPDLARYTGRPVNLDVYTDQEVLFVHDRTGEVTDEPLFEDPEEAGDVHEEDEAGQAAETEEDEADQAEEDEGEE